MFEHRVGLRRDTNAAELGRLCRELTDLHAADVLDASRIIGIADDAVRDVSDLPWDVTEVRCKAIPLERDAGVRLVIALAEPEDQQRLAAGDSRGSDCGLDVIVHDDWLLDRKTANIGSAPKLVGRDAELLAKCTG